MVPTAVAVRVVRLSQDGHGDDRDQSGQSRPQADPRRWHQSLLLPEQNPPLAWCLCALPSP